MWLRHCGKSGPPRKSTVCASSEVHETASIYCSGFSIQRDTRTDLHPGCWRSSSLPATAVKIAISVIMNASNFLSCRIVSYHATAGNYVQVKTATIEVNTDRHSS